MAGLATNGEIAVINAITGLAVAVAASWIGLHTGDPGTGTSSTGEIATGAYARQSATVSGYTTTGNNPAVASNAGVLTYPVATASYSVGGFSVNSLVTAGTFYGGGTVTTPKTVNVGDTARFAIGALTITVN